MSIYENLKDNTIVITNSENKEKLLKYINENKLLINIKFMDINEFKKHYLFDYNVDTIYYLYSKGDSHIPMKVENAIEIINNLYYVDINKEYNSDKLNYLVSIKKELIDKDLLIFDKHFSNYIKSKNVICYDYYDLTKVDKSLLDEINTTYINEEYSPFKPKLYCFKTLNEETEYVFNRISDLLINGVDINNIKLIVSNSEYISVIKRFSIFYNIPILFPNENKLISLNIVNNILNNLELENIENNLEYCSDSYIKNSITRIINKYINYDLNSIKDLLIYDFKNTKIMSDKGSNFVEIIENSKCIDSNTYLFQLGFNSEYPSMSKDENYITDKMIIDNNLNLDLTIDKNKRTKYISILNFYKFHNIVLTYSESSPFTKFFHSILVDNLELVNMNENSFKYSSLLNKMKLNSYLDEYYKFDIENKDLGLLFNNYNDNTYNSYDNKFKDKDNLINKNTILNRINKLTLSYSNVNTYYECPFKYYLGNILNINKFENSYYTILGSLFHEILSEIMELNLRDSLNYIDSSYNNKLIKYSEQYKYNISEYYFLSKLKDDLKYIVSEIAEHNSETSLNNFMLEKKIAFSLDDNTIFKGFIDKIMYKDLGNETIISVIDYKTGNPDINIDNIKYGLNMQLTAYLYLIRHGHELSPIFNNRVSFCGFYLQKILQNDIKINPKKSLDEQKRDNLKLCGYSTIDMDRLNYFDPTYENSKYIKGLKVTKSGSFSAYSKVLDDSTIDNLIDITEKKIIEAKDNILSGNFSISPKTLKGVDMSCSFCEFRDICYKTNKDIVNLDGYIEDTDDEKESKEEENEA